MPAPKKSVIFGIVTVFCTLQAKNTWASDHPVQHSGYPSLSLILLTVSILTAMLVAALLLRFEVTEVVSKWRRRKRLRIREKF